MSGPWPGGYNRVQEEPHRVWTMCPNCGWKTPKHVPGRSPNLVLCEPFACPKCAAVLSGTTVYRK